MSLSPFLLCLKLAVFVAISVPHAGIPRKMFPEEMTMYCTICGGPIVEPGTVGLKSPFIYHPKVAEG